MDDQIDIRFVNLETKFDIMQKFHNLNGDSLGDHLTWILDLKEKQKKQEEFNANADKVLSRIDTSLEELKEELRLLEQYTVKGLTDNLRDLQYDIETKLERIDDILVVQRNQTDNQRKNFHELRKVLDDKVMDLLEKGEHGKE